jgi:hypothetical protein
MLLPQLIVQILSGDRSFDSIQWICREICWGIRTRHAIKSVDQQTQWLRNLCFRASIAVVVIVFEQSAAQGCRRFTLFGPL